MIGSLSSTIGPIGITAPLVCEVMKSIMILFYRVYGSRDFRGCAYGMKNNEALIPHYVASMNHSTPLLGPKKNSIISFVGGYVDFGRPFVK